MRDRRFLWRSGRIFRPPMGGFWSPTLTTKNPQIPHLPLETPVAVDMTEGVARGGAEIRVCHCGLGHNTLYIYCNNPTERTVTVRVKWSGGEQNQLFTAGQSEKVALPEIMFSDFSYDGGTYLWANGLEIGFKSVA